MEYKGVNNNKVVQGKTRLMGKIIRSELCKNQSLTLLTKWYVHKPESFIEDDKGKILWDFICLFVCLFWLLWHINLCRVFNAKFIFFTNKQFIFPNLPTPPLGQDMTQGHFLSGVWQVWVQSFPSPRLVASPKLKNLVCPTILSIAGGRIIGFIPFPRVLVLREMQLAWSRIWTRVAVSISYDDNQNTTGTSSLYFK